MAEPNRDDQLQQYFDEELPAEEMDALRDELAQDAELQAKLDGLTHLRALIREAYEPGSLELPVGSDDAFAAITARLDEADEEPAQTADTTEEAAERPALRVVDGGQKDAPEASKDDAASSRGMWLGVGGLALAAAAALLIFFLRPTDGTTPTPGGDDTDPDGPVATAEPPPGSEIEQVDLGHSTGAIFQVEDEGALYAVVWISDEKPELPEDAAAFDEEREERVQ